MQEQIKELRVKIDGLYQLTNNLKPCKEYNLSQIEYSDVRGNKHVKFEDRIISPIISNSKEIEDAAHSLIYAKAWLGKLLGELGEQTPYANDGKRNNVDDIEPAADTHHQINQTHVLGKEKGLIPEEYLLSFNHIQKVDWLRQEIEKIVIEVKQIGNAPNPPMLNREISIARTNAYTRLTEARFALGFELYRIKQLDIAETTKPF